MSMFNENAAEFGIPYDRPPAVARRRVDVTPGVNAEKSRAISAFINGPESFENFADLVARTIEHNPTRTVSSLRRGILHNALEREDGTWVWRYRRLSDVATHPDFTELW